MVPCIFACHHEAGGVMYRSGTPKVRPRAGGFKFIKRNVGAVVMCEALIEVFIPFAQDCGATLFVADCGCKIHLWQCVALCREFGISVYPRANQDHTFKGYPAYSPKTMPLDECIFPLLASKTSKFMKLYSDKKRRQSTLQYLLYKNIGKIWNSDEIQNLCRRGVLNQEKVCKNIIETNGYLLEESDSESN